MTVTPWRFLCVGKNELPAGAQFLHHFIGSHSVAFFSVGKNELPAGAQFCITLLQAGSLVVVGGGGEDWELPAVAEGAVAEAYDDEGAGYLLHHG